MTVDIYSFHCIYISTYLLTLRNISYSHVIKSTYYIKDQPPILRLRFNILLYYSN